MKKSIIQPLAALACGALISAQALAFGGGHRGLDWEEELNLTEHQEDQIDAIEDRYQDQFHAMRQNKGQRQERHQQVHSLIKQMRAEIQQVLTKEQRAAARKLVAERRQHAMKKRLRKVARKLDMTEEQQTRLQQRVSSDSQNYQWPMDQEQRQQARQAFDLAMQDVLTGEQQQEWQSMKARFKKRWRREKYDGGRHEDHHRGDDHDHDHDHDNEHGGFRRGYHSW